MDRVGKLPGKGRFVLLISHEEYLELKAKGFKINDSIPIQKPMFGFTKGQKALDLKEEEHHKTIFWKTCEDFFDLQIRRNATHLKFQSLARFEVKLRQGKPLSMPEKNFYNKELIRKRTVLETWFNMLKAVEALGYGEEYISKVIQYAQDDIPTKKQREKQPNWPGWAKIFLSINTILKESSNKISRWENMVASYERNLEKQISIDKFFEEGEF